MGLLPNANMKPGTRYPDFLGSGLVLEARYLPEYLWKASDREQFKYLDSLIGKRPFGTTWNHSELTARMELVPFGIHNIINHRGGRSPGHWAYRPGGR